MWTLLLATAQASPRDAKDFEQLWQFVAERYAYLPERPIDWAAVHDALAPRALAARTRDEWIAVLEDALDQLYDPHCMLNTNNDASWRPVPHGVYAEWRDGRAMVTAVQGVGAVAGDEVIGVDGQPLAAMVAARHPRFLTAPDPAADDWALLSAVAGRHGGPHPLQLRHADGREEVVTLAPAPESEELTWSRVEPNLGRIEIHSFGDPGLVDRFDQALAELAGVDGLIIDLRSNSGGDTTVALPMIGRLIGERAQYAWMARREGDGLGERWPEFVDPRGERVDLPVVAVVDRFTVSMGEGFAMALQDTGRGRVVGTAMGGLGAAIERITLRKSKISAQISTEPIYAVDGTPRSDLVPDVVVDPTGPGDPYLAAAIAALTAPG